MIPAGFHGVAAVGTALLSFLGASDHLLMVDSVDDPVRSLCQTLLRRRRIETKYYNPRLDAGIAARLRPNTKVLYMESPGSLTIEVQDVAAIAAAAALP